MNKVMKAIKEFHEILNDPMPEKAEFPTLAVRKLRRKLLQEEFTEYKQAENANDLVEVADALADMIYIIAGTAHTYGIDLEAVFNEVHASNMAKFPDGKVMRRKDGKILKPDDWVPPNIKHILRSKDNG